MTAMTVSARAAEDASPRPLPWRRMAWVTWRQHRVALGGAAVLLGGLAVWLWRVGSSAHQAYAAAAACHPASSSACGLLVGNFIGSMSTGQNISIVLQVVPALIGAFVGAPVLAREMETGTFRYAWTLGFGRWRWALAKLVLLGVAVAAAAGAFSLLFSWYYQPFFTQTFSGNVQIPLGTTVFDLHGVAFAAWTLAAFAIGALAGMLIRRVVPALAVTLAIYAGLAVAAGGYLREHYITPLLVKNGSPPSSAWIISQQWYGKNGQPVPGTTLAQALQQGAPQLAGGGKGGIPESPFVNQWLVQHGFTLWTTYQPGSRFWPFQWIEGGWLLGLSALLIAAAIWLVRRRAS
jgi:hypothetical protein